MSGIIEIVVAPDGQTVLQAKGFPGAACRDATRLLERALGVVSKEELTAEFHQTGTSNSQNTSIK